MKQSYLDQREDLNDEINAFISKESTESTMPITSKVITVTPSDAAKFLAKMVHNRPLSATNVKAYTNEILSGRWAVTGQGIIFDDKGRLLDGQHRMHAVIKANKSIQLMAVYGVNSETFSSMDTGNRRTLADVIEVKNRNTVAGACKYLFREMSGCTWSTNKRPRPSDGIAIIKAHPGIVTSAEYIRSVRGVHKYIPASTAAYCYYRASLENKALCDAFFTGLNSGADLGERSPILALRNALDPVAGMRVNEVHAVSLFIIAWGIFKKHGQAKFLRLPKDIPSWDKALV